MRTAFLLFSALLLTPASAAAQSSGPPPLKVDTLPNSMARLADGQARAAGKSDPTLLNTHDIFNADNYPRLAREREVEGVVRIRVEVDPSGLATDCRTLGSPPVELGGPTCALVLLRGRFEPARDRKGQAVKGRIERQVRWVLAEADPMPIEESTERFAFRFDDVGTLVGCTGERKLGAFMREAEAQLEKDTGEGFPDPCKAMALGAKEMAVSSAPKPLSQWELTVEMMTRIGEGSSWRTIGSGPDERLVLRVGYTVEVGADGKVTACTPLTEEQKLLPPAPVTCEDLEKTRYVAASETRRVFQLINVTYWKRRKAG